MKTYPFTEALGICKAVLYDLTAKQVQFYYRTEPDKKQMIFTAGAKSADTIKSLYPAFEIALDSRQQRYVELIISYDN